MTEEPFGYEWRDKARDDAREKVEDLETEGIILMGQKYLSKGECLRLQEIGDRLDEQSRKPLLGSLYGIHPSKSE